MTTQLMVQKDHQEVNVDTVPSQQLAHIHEDSLNQEERGKHLSQFNDRMEDYAAKLEYQQKLQAEIDGLNSRINEFFTHLSDSVQIYLSSEHQQLIQQLMEQRDALLQQKHDLEQASSRSETVHYFV
ncbi:MAG: hypothetical protein ACO3NK_09410 [Prochlorotrichaceae cyanobacterium]|jgi:uncharacterized protein involved in exopolysaccharide biosynthesis